MMNEFKIEGKKVSIKYNLMTTSKPKIRSFLSQEPSKHFLLQFEVLYNRKLNRRASLFYLFEKHYFPFRITNRYYSDQFIDEVRYTELQEDREGEIKWHLSDLILLEKFHIYSVLEITKGWNEDSFSLSNFGEIYEKSTIFAIDLIEDAFMDNVLFVNLGYSLNVNDEIYQPFFSIVKENYYGFSKSYEFFSLMLKKLNFEVYTSFTEQVKPYVDLFETMKELLKPEIIHYTTVTEKGEYLDKGRLAKNIVTLPTWIADAYQEKLIQTLTEKNVPKLDFAIRVIRSVNKKMMDVKEEIIELFKN
jgi:hypothetical protein